MVIIYKFTQCTYEELNKILEKYHFQLSGWRLIEKEYVNNLEKVESETGELIALLYYWFTDDLKNNMCLGFFEVLKVHRGKGHGEKIIKQFLKSYSGKVFFTPCDDDVINFWEKCGL